MKKHFKNIFYNNWSFIITFIFIQLKSMVLLSMLRTENSSSLDLNSIYFTKPFILGHFLIIISILSFVFLFKPKNRFKASMIINLFISILFIFDISYYRSNGAFLSYKHLLHPAIFNPTNKTLFNFRIVDLLFIIDFVPLFLLNIFISNIKTSKDYNDNFYFRAIKAVLIFFTSFSLINIYHNKIDITKEISNVTFFSLSWAPFQTYSDMSPLGYHFYDIAYFTNKKKELSIEEKKEINQWFENNKENLQDNKYKDLLKGKNIIALQVESLENFVINQKVYGQEITPTLNKLLSNSIYFNNIYEQNNSGTSSDADFMVNTSIFPLRNLSTFPTYPWVKYNTLQRLLKANNYTTLSTHAEIAGNWNWAENHKSFGADKILDISNYNVDEVIGLGLSDESYLKQVSNKITDLDSPFYTFVTTLTSHGPFDIPENKKYLDIPEELDKTILGAYFQSIRYTDEAIKVFLLELSKNNLLNNTVIMIYGDHTGVHKFYEEELTSVNLEGDWWKINDKKIPFIIYSKDLKGEVNSMAGGQVDFLPTISYLVGIDRSNFESTSMGRILVNTNRNSTILNNGKIIGENVNEGEKSHLENAFKIADNIIKGNYFEK